MSDGAALGRFPVVGSRLEADAFCRATGADSSPTLPLTFPMRWLAAPAIRAALLDLVGATDVVLVHESQSFAYTHSLHVDQPYALTVTARRETAPDRLIVDGVIADAESVEQASMETILRLIAAPPEAAS